MDTDRILRPIRETGGGFAAAGGVLLLVVLWMLYAWLTQLRNGLAVTGLGDWGVGQGAPWGLYIASFVWFDGIALGSIAVSAVIRLFRLDVYRIIARIAEVIAVITLMMASASIMFDIGRPDRVFNIVRYFTQRVGFSPIVWDMTSITVFFCLSVTYLVITMRRDVAGLRDKLPGRFGFMYSFVLFGYRRDETAKVERMMRWLALMLLIMVVLLSGGVVPWLFGLMVSQAGWFSALQGPMFLVAGVATALAAVIIVAALVRASFGWKDLLPDRVFFRLSQALLFPVLGYLYLMLQEQLTINYAGPVAEQTVADALLSGQFAPLFWLVVFALGGAALYLALNWVGDFHSQAGAVGISLLVLGGFWLKRVLLVVPTFLFPRLPYLPGAYSPTWVEWSLLTGMLALSALLFMLFTKVFPLAGPENSPGK